MVHVCVAEVEIRFKGMVTLCYTCILCWRITDTASICHTASEGNAFYAPTQMSKQQSVSLSFTVRYTLLSRKCIYGLCQTQMTSHLL